MNTLDSMRYNLKNPTSTLPAYIGTCLPICLYRPPCLEFRREEQEEAKVKDKEEEAEEEEEEEELEEEEEERRRRSRRTYFVRL